MTTTITHRRSLLLGYLASFGAAIGLGGAVVVAREVVSNHASPIVATAYTTLFGTVMVAALFYRQVIHDLVRAPKHGWLYMSLAGLTGTAGAAFWFTALSKSPVVLVAPVVGTSPLIVILLTHIFLQRYEKVTWRTVTGAALVVAGVALISATQ